MEILETDIQIQSADKTLDQESHSQGELLSGDKPIIVQAVKSKDDLHDLTSQSSEVIHLPHTAIGQTSDTEDKTTSPDGSPKAQNLTPKPNGKRGESVSSSELIAQQDHESHVQKDELKKSADSHVTKPSKKRKCSTEKQKTEHLVKKTKADTSIQLTPEKSEEIVGERRSRRLSHKSGDILKTAAMRKARLNNTQVSSLSRVNEKTQNITVVKQKRSRASKSLQITNKITEDGSLNESKKLANEDTDTKLNQSIKSHLTDPNKESVHEGNCPEPFKDDSKQSLSQCDTSEKLSRTEVMETDDDTDKIILEILKEGNSIKEVSNIEELDRSEALAMFINDDDDDTTDQDFGVEKKEQHDDESDDISDVEDNKCLKDFKDVKPTTKATSKKHSKAKSKSKKKEIKCTECGKTMPAKQYPSHLRCVHRKLNAFKCNKCSQSFNSSIALNKHKLWHTEKKNVQDKKKSEQMEDIFFSSKKLPEKNNAIDDQHLAQDLTESVEAQKEIFTCNICLKSLRTKIGLENHMELHNSEDLQCKVCHKTFVTKQRLQIHESIHNEEKISCQVCQEKFTQPKHLIQHCRKEHNDKREVCHLCGIFFDTPYDKNKHRLTHMKSHCSNFICPKCGKTFELMRYLKTHNMKYHNGKEEICKICCGFFTTKAEYRKHMWDHRKDFTYMCKICKDSFESSELLLTHMTNDHNCRLYICETCGEQYNNFIDFKKHKTYAHNPDALFSCKLCDSKFLEERKLNEHMKQVHSDVRPYQCEECGMCFKANPTLRRHILTHTKDSFRDCQFCDAKFRSIDGLNNHVLDKHSNEINPERLNFRVYECEYCGKRTSQKTIYIRHLRSHTGEKPYPCDFCDKRFPLPAALNRHIKHRHSQTYKKHSCEVCGIKFASSSHLKRHCTTQAHRLKADGLSDSRFVSETVDDESPPVEDTIDIQLDETNSRENMHIVYLDSSSKDNEQVYTIENTSMLNLPESTIYVISHVEDPNVIVKLESEHS